MMEIFDFSGDRTEKQNALDSALEYVHELEARQETISEELKILDKYGDLYEEFKEEFLSQRLEYLRLRKESLPYSEEKMHRHLDGQIAEVKWEMKTREEVIHELKQSEVEISRRYTTISKLRKSLEG